MIFTARFLCSPNRSFGRLPRRLRDYRESETPTNLVAKGGFDLGEGKRWGWYHFGRLASVEYNTATEEIFFTNELGQVIRASVSKMQKTLAMTMQVT